MDHNYAIWSPESFVFSPWSNDQSQQPLPQHYNSLGFSASVPGSLADLGSTNSELFYTTYCTPKTKSRTCAPGNGDELSIVPNQTVQSRRDQPSKSPRLPLFFSQLSPAFSWKNTPRIPRTYGDLRGGLDRITTLKRWRTTFYGSQSFWLLLYFSFNLLLTLSNKSVMTSFPFPYTLTAIHAMCSSFGGYLLRRQGFYIPRRLSFSDEMVLAAFSILYSVNIAVSNVSLHLVTVPFHQVVRAITPFFTIILSKLLLGSRTSICTILSLIPVIIGVAVATYGDYYFTWCGFCLTLLGTFLAALKTIYTNVLQSSRLASSSHRSHTNTHIYPKPLFLASSRYMQGNWWSNRLVLARCLLPPSLNLHPLDLLARMSPLAFIQCVIYAQLTGELDRLRQLSTLGPHLPSVPDEPSYLSPLNGTQAWNTTLYEGCADFSPHTQNGLANSQLLILLVNGCIAFGLNVISFTANGKVGSLSMTVAANVKQVLTILLAVSLFGLNITFTNAVGISITLGGGACYAWVEYTSKKIPRTTSRERTT